MSIPETKQTLVLEHLDPSGDVAFTQPKKMIHEADDVSFFLASQAYTDIVTFLLQLNASMFPRTGKEQSEEMIVTSPTIVELQVLLSSLSELISKAPPDPGPRRFGNVSFRKWFSLVESQADDLLNEHLPPIIVGHRLWTNESESPRLELKAYLLGSFGSAQRLDYGTGHELSFLAFLGCIWKLGGFGSTCNGQIEKAIVDGVVKPYLDLVRRLILTYNLEPAGSHGVWGLDDHAFIPYIFGSAQLAPPIEDKEHVPAEGSAPGAPDPSDVTKLDIVNNCRDNNMYFGAIGFIYDVKKGPFWEHSPILFDISGVKAGWAKINKGMIKMYIGEVLSKFPVVQHFPFGVMFKWERDPKASNFVAATYSAASSSSSSSMPSFQSSDTQTGQIRQGPLMAGATAPWVTKTSSISPRGAAPPISIPGFREMNNSSRIPDFSIPSMQQSLASSRNIPGSGKSGQPATSTSDSLATSKRNPSSNAYQQRPTRAPWAKDP